MRKTTVVAALASAAALLVAGCADSDTERPDERVQTSQQGEERNPDGPDEQDRDQAQDGRADTDDEGRTPSTGKELGEPLSVSVRDPLRSSTGGFQSTEFDSGASLEYTGEAYRMTSPGAPLYATYNDLPVHELATTEVRAEVTSVSGDGLSGVTCGTDESRAYLFLVGTLDDEPYFAIAHLDITGAASSALRDSNMPEAADPTEVLPADGGTVTVEGRCEPGDSPDEAVLSMSIDGTEVVDVRTDTGSPTGLPGLYAGGTGDEVVTDFNVFEAAGDPA